MFYLYVENQQKIRIENDEIWNKILLKTEQDFLAKKTNTPQITLLISNPLKKGFRYYEENPEKNNQMFSYVMSNRNFLFFNC